MNEIRFVGMKYYLVVLYWWTIWCVDVNYYLVMGGFTLVVPSLCVDGNYYFVMFDFTLVVPSNVFTGTTCLDGNSYLVLF